MSKLKTGDLSQCNCEGTSDLKIPAAGSFQAPPQYNPGQQLVAPKKPRKPRSKGAGEHCVISHKGRVVHCYTDRGVAERVAKAFTARGKSGSTFRVSRKSDSEG